MRPALLAAVSLLAVPVFGQSPGIVRFRLAETDTTWVTQPRCTEAFEDGTRACRQIVPAPDDEGWVERPGGTVARWAAAGIAYQSLGFDLVRVDLGGDGTPELVLAHHESEGNGLGVRWWTLYVVDGQHPDAAPLSFASAEHGDDAFVRTPRGIRLLAGTWEDGRDPRRGAGLYFTGRLYRYDGATGTLVPDAAAPAYRRRYLNSFAAQRGRSYEAEERTGQRGVPGQTPWRWLQHRGTLRLRTDPRLPTTRRLGAPEAVQFLGLVAHEGLLGYAYRHAGSDAPSFTGPLLTRGGRLLPDGYVPRGGWPEGGVPARLTRYAPPPVPAGEEDTGGEPTYVVELGH